MLRLFTCICIAIFVLGFAPSASGHTLPDKDLVVGHPIMIHLEDLVIDAIAPPAPPPPITDADSVQTPMWICIRQAESGDNYGSVSGAYGILVSTWNDVLHYDGYPGEYADSIQDEAALKLYSMYGFNPWNDYCTGRGYG